MTRAGTDRPSPCGPGHDRPDDSPAGRRPAGPAGTSPRQPTPARRPQSTTARPERLAEAFAQLYLEVESGNRPRPLLKTVMDPLLYLRLRDLWVRGGVPGRVVRVHGCPVTDEVYEAVAVVQRGERYGALGLRLERRSAGWRIASVERPEDGPLPAPPYRMPRPGPDAFELVLDPRPAEVHIC